MRAPLGELTHPHSHATPMAAVTAGRLHVTLSWRMGLFKELLMTQSLERKSSLVTTELTSALTVGPSLNSTFGWQEPLRPQGKRIKGQRSHAGKMQRRMLRGGWGGHGLQQVRGHPEPGSTWKIMIILILLSHHLTVGKRNPCKTSRPYVDSNAYEELEWQYKKSLD